MGYPVPSTDLIYYFLERDRELTRCYRSAAMSERRIAS